MVWFIELAVCCVAHVSIAMTTVREAELYSVFATRDRSSLKNAACVVELTYQKNL